MIAKIIPLKNLPSNFFVFDYLIPKKIEKKIKIGQLVKIELRKTIIFGIVYSLENKNNNNLKEVLEIIEEKILIDQTDLKIYNELAQFYKISLANLIKMALLPLQKNKLKKLKLKNFSKKKILKTKREYFLYNDEKEHEKLYSKLKTKQSTLILVPEIRFLNSIEKLISKNLKDKIIFWHSELSPKEKFDNWLKIKNREKKIVIATRSALLLPASFYDNIIIDFEQDENHKQWEGSPKFSTKDVVEIINKITKKNITFASYSPSFEKYYEITKNNLKINQKLSTEKLIFKDKKQKNISIYDFNREQNFYQSAIFSLQIELEIKKEIENKKNIFIYINKKGFSSTFHCKKCNFINYQTNLNTYKEDFNSVCPKCNSKLTRLDGIGTETVEKYIQKLNTNNEYQIIKIDSDTKNTIINFEQPQIYIGTEKAFSQIDWQKINSFIILDLDRQLAIPEFMMTEKIWHNLAEINYFRNPESQILIQTRNPDHVFFKSLGEIDRIYRYELNTRKKLLYPPYSYLIKYFHLGINKNENKEKVEMTFKNISSLLTKHAINVKMIAVFEMQTSFYSKVNYYAFALKLDNENFFETIKFINQYIENDYKIDPNPINLISP